MQNFKRIAAIFTVVAVVGLVGWYLGLRPGHHGRNDHPEYQNQRY